MPQTQVVKHMKPKIEFINELLREYPKELSLLSKDVRIAVYTSKKCKKIQKKKKMKLIIFH